MSKRQIEKKKPVCVPKRCKKNDIRFKECPKCGEEACTANYLPGHQLWFTSDWHGSAIACTDKCVYHRCSNCGLNERFCEPCYNHHLNSTICQGASLKRNQLALNAARLKWSRKTSFSDSESDEEEEEEDIAQRTSHPSVSGRVCVDIATQTDDSIGEEEIRTKRKEWATKLTEELEQDKKRRKTNEGSGSSVKA